MNHVSTGEMGTAAGRVKKNYGLQFLLSLVFSQKWKNVTKTLRHSQAALIEV